MLDTLQGWPRGQGRDAPMSAINIYKLHRWIEVMTYSPTSVRIIWKIHKNIYCLFLNRQKNSSKSLPSFIFESSTKELAHSVIFWFWLSDLRLTTEPVADSNQLSNKVTAGMESPNGVIANCDNLPQSALETRILTIRGIQVKLDRDLQSSMVYQHQG